MAYYSEVRICDYCNGKSMLELTTIYIYIYIDMTPEKSFELQKLKASMNKVLQQSALLSKAEQKELLNNLSRSFRIIQE